MIQEWNKAEVYAKTIALFADKLNGGHDEQGGQSGVAEEAAPRMPTAARRADKNQRARQNRRATRPAIFLWL